MDDEWREIKNGLIRTLIAIAAPAAIGVYLSQRYTLEKNLEAGGILAVALIAVLAVYSLIPGIFDRYGKLTVAAFAIWATSSTFWRLLGFAEVIDASERLLANTIVALVLDGAGVYVLFLHRSFCAFYRYLLPKAGA